jgi:hypothetical protein
MLDDYLDRNQYVVKKAIGSDKLAASTLKSLLKIEKSDKKRTGVIKAIEKRLEEVE